MLLDKATGKDLSLSLSKYKYTPMSRFHCISLIIFIYSFVPVKSACEDGWMHYGKSCFWFSYESLNWYDAQSSCRAHNARLAEVDSQGVGNFLGMMANAFGKSYFLGGRDDVIEGEWRWSSTGQKFSFTDWDTGEPNSYKGHTENCLEIHPSGNGHWNDEFCEYHKYYICEKSSNWLTVPGKR